MRPFTSARSEGKLNLTATRPIKSPSNRFHYAIITILYFGSQNFRTRKYRRAADLADRLAALDREKEMVEKMLRELGE